LVDEKRQTKQEGVMKQEVVMDIGQVTVKEILEKRLGKEKAAGVLKEINDAYQKGKRGEDLQEHFKDAIKKEGLDPGDIKFALYAMILPPI
jgi:uncharacterized protein with von Willebrand factor type A (vWA) domain